MRAQRLTPLPITARRSPKLRRSFCSPYPHMQHLNLNHDAFPARSPVDCVRYIHLIDVAASSEMYLHFKPQLPVPSQGRSTSKPPLRHHRYVPVSRRRGITLGLYSHTPLILYGWQACFNSPCPPLLCIMSQASTP